MHTAFTTCATGSTRTMARSSAWSTLQTPTPQQPFIAKLTGSSPTRSTPSPREPDSRPCAPQQWAPTLEAAAHCPATMAGDADLVEGCEVELKAPASGQLSICSG